jgi:hypothetical protein
MLAVKAPSTQGISALLKKAGFKRSESHTTAVKGWRDRTEGYAVRKGYPEGVSVDHVTSDFRYTDATRERITRMLGKYTEAIEAAGWHVEETPRGLIVTRREEG